MSQVCLLDSDRLSALLRDALSWSDNVSSLLVSAVNGSILAYAYRGETPSIKEMRTQSTTMTAAYTVASEDILVFEAQNMGAISVITPVADHVLLAVTGPEPHQRSRLQNGETDEVRPTANGTDNPAERDEDEDEPEDDEELEDTQPIRTDLEMVGQELGSILREELTIMRWPEDI